MKTLSALVFSLLFFTGSIFAQQQPGTAQQDSSSGSDYKVAKKSVSKAKAGKKQSAAAVDADGVPLARARHVEKLAKAIPGNGGETPNGPAGAAEDAFQQRAFPDADIPLERLLAARSAAANLKSRDFPTGKGRPGTWVTVGPSEAIYPLTPLRTSSVYVPNTYDAASRTTALAISPGCVTGHCTLWASPAGGGIWRTKNALEGEPNWTFLSASFAINSVGSIAVDPNDPSGNTLWVGTGEANACGSGCEAGVGLYKSTDGGDTWSGPIGASVFNARGVSTIAIKPGDPNTIFAGSTRAIRGVSSVCCDGAVSFIPGAAKWGLYTARREASVASFSTLRTQTPFTQVRTPAGFGAPAMEEPPGSRSRHR